MANSISDMMNKFSDMMGNSSSSAVHSEAKNDASFDVSKISPEMIQNVAQMFNKSSGNNSSSSIDMDTILKLKGLMEQMNRRDTPDSNLLASLKPYLKESRKNKVDQYIGLLNMSKAMNLFGNFGGGKVKWCTLTLMECIDLIIRIIIDMVPELLFLRKVVFAIMSCVAQNIIWSTMLCRCNLRNSRRLTSRHKVRCRRKDVSMHRQKSRRMLMGRYRNMGKYRNRPCLSRTTGVMRSRFSIFLEFVCFLMIC